MKILLTSRRGTIELVLDTDKITGNEAIPYNTRENQGIDEIKNICENNMPIFRISSEPRQKYGLNQTKKKLNYFVDKVHNLC